MVLEPISWNRQQHCLQILWLFNFCPSGAVRRWSIVATLGVRRMPWPELVIQSPQIRFHFRLYFSKKDQIARRKWFSGVSFRAFLWFASGPSKSPHPCRQCCVEMQSLEFSQKIVLQFQHWLQGLEGILLAIVAAHFSRGIVFSKLVWKFPQRAFPGLQLSDNSYPWCFWLFFESNIDIRWVGFSVCDQQGWEQIFELLTKSLMIHWYFAV